MMSSMPESGPDTSLKITFPEKYPLFYYITDRRALASPSDAALLRIVRKVLARGVDFIQVREKDLSDRRLFELTCRIVELAHDTPCRVLVNTRADIALAAGANGVHLPSSGLAIVDVRSWVPEDFIIGVSVHSLREIRIACEAKVNYILAGHTFPTASKAGYGPNLGLGFLLRAVVRSSVPVLALGGMTAERIPSVLETGVAGIAGISLFQKKSNW